MDAHTGSSEPTCNRSLARREALRADHTTNQQRGPSKALQGVPEDVLRAWPRAQTLLFHFWFDALDGYKV